MVVLKRIESIRRLLDEAEGYLEKGDAVQSSEKLYKAAEECIKILSERLSLPEVKDAEERGRWTVTLLERAVRKLTGKMGVDVQLGWDATNHLHVWGVPAAIGDLESQEQFNSLY
jgi:hypothetical protein